MNTITTTFDFPRAAEAAIEYVEKRGAVTFMELCDELYSQVRVPISGEEVMVLGSHPLGDGRTQTRLPNPRNVVLWNCGSPEVLAVLEAVLADPRVVLERHRERRLKLAGVFVLVPALLVVRFRLAQK